MPALQARYRPTKFSEVVGQTEVVKALQALIKRREQQAYLFASTLPGFGKTTLARISAQELGCSPRYVTEIPAANFTGVDDMREVMRGLKYKPFGDTKGRAVILDECTRLSGHAWDSLLKDVEEPPEDVYWFFCTTNVDKVPKAIRSRCQTFTLKPVSDKELAGLMGRVCEAEGWELHDDVARLVVSEANGSPRQMLVNLDLCRNAKDKKEAGQLLLSAQASDATLELCRFLMRDQGRTWEEAMKIVGKLDTESPEGIRITVCNYVASVLKNAKNERETRFALDILEQFSTPYNQSERYAPLMLSIGRVLYPDVTA
jgi:DNA polymerase III gamma/tau subunit